jgi:hypothetical protein
LVEDDILSRLFDEFDQECGYKFVYETILNHYFNLIRTEVPQEKVTFILKDITKIPEIYEGIVNLNIDTVEKPGRKEYELKKEKEREKEKLAQAKGGVKKEVKLNFEPELFEKTLIMSTLTEKKMIIVKNLPFETMIRNNILECIYLLVKIDTDSESKEEIRNKIESYVNTIEDACIKKLQAIDNLEVFEFNVPYS